MERRKFLKLSCSMCVAAAGAGILLPSLSGCSPIPVIKASVSDNTLTVPLTSFKDGKLAIVRSMKLDSDILLVKKSDSEVNALLMKCTHQDNPLTATATGLNCPTHGSSFDLDGNVTHDPATRPLKKYTTEVTATAVIIHLA
ncbi:MAG TPA: Rieske (2Fe-2S) protein [Bacteroidia bacterium]|jgi:Rieske Fe-S protein|nr:Rieske (2Fe-2S) protein [Bacteroidia bacterium]